MNISEERREIEAVLRGLSEVEAPTHLGQEIAQQLSLNLQAVSATEQRSRPWSFLWRPLTLGVVSAVLIVLVLIAYPYGLRSRSAGSQPRQPNVQQATMSTPFKPLRELSSSTQASPKVHVEKVSRSRQRKTDLVQRVANSHPAPIAPLTEQERILIRIAQRRDPIQLASLNTKLRDAMDISRRKEFIRFSNGGSQ